MSEAEVKGVVDSVNKSGDDSDFPNALKVYLGPSIGWVMEPLTDAPQNTAGNILFTPSGSISSNNVQAAIQEMDAEKISAARQVLTTGLATGGGSLQNDVTITVPIATTAQAEAGTDDATAMTPLKVQEAIINSAYGRVYISDTAPTAPDNSLWWETDNGILYLKYNDGNSSQWVQAVAVPQPPSGILLEAPTDGFTYGRLNAAWAKAAPLNSPALTGTPTAPTPTVGDNSTKIATTAFVASSTPTGLAPLNSPAFTGTPTAPTPTAGTNNTQLATTAFVTAALASGSSIYVSDTPPSSPQPNALWWKSSVGNLFIYYNDGDSTQWVAAVPVPDVSQFVNKAGDTMTGALGLPAGGNGIGVAPNAYPQIGQIMAGTLNASGGLARGLQVSTSCVASANNDQLSGELITSNLNSNGKTGVLGVLLNVQGSFTGTFDTQYAIYSGSSALSYLGGPLSVSGNIAGTSNLILTNSGYGIRVVQSGTPAMGYNSACELDYTGGGTTYGMIANCFNDASYPHLFYNNGSGAGSITVNGSACAFNTTSDARLKEDAKAFDAIAILARLKTYNFKWKRDGRRAHGVFAQEAVEVYPEAINHSKELDMWGTDYSKFVPVLIRALQQALERIEALEAR